MNEHNIKQLLSHSHIAAPDDFSDRLFETIAREAAQKAAQEAAHAQLAPAFSLMCLLGLIGFIVLAAVICQPVLVETLQRLFGVGARQPKLIIMIGMALMTLFSINYGLRLLELGGRLTQR